MALPELRDGSVADFGRGATDAGAYVAHSARGEVVLTPSVAGEFTGPGLPPGWTVTPWVDGGSGTFTGDRLALDGARLASDSLLLSPRSIEISAAFAARPDQHAGFGTDFIAVPWVMFSTKWGRRLYGRTHLLTVGDTRLTGDWLGEPHVFRIDWNVLDVVFSADGDQLARLLLPFPGHMRALAANQRLGGPPLEIEWIRISPYPRRGRFTSRVLDAGAPVAWAGLDWEAIVPEGTSVGIRVRTGATADPDAGWTPWRPVARPGGAIGATARYLQYRAELATEDSGRTPVLHLVAATYRSSAAPSGSSTSSSGSAKVIGFQ